MNRPNFYKCKYRGNVPGDAHSCCRYPGNDTNLFAMFDQDNLIQMIKLGIKADRYGFENGWFMWPVNFDPAWLLNCNGFTPKDGDVMNGQPD